MVSATQPVSPFVVNDHGDLHVVDSLRSPGVEPFDASDFEYFDAEGKRLRAVVEARRVSLELDESAPPDPQRLRRLIEAYVEAVNTRGHVGESDRALFDEVREAPDLRSSILALGRLIDANESRGLLSRITRRRRS